MRIVHDFPPGLGSQPFLQGSSPSPVQRLISFLYWHWVPYNLDGRSRTQITTQPPCDMTPLSFDLALDCRRRSAATVLRGVPVPASRSGGLLPAEEETTPPHHLHGGAAGTAGGDVRTHPLPGCAAARTARTQGRPQGGASGGEHSALAAIVAQ